MTKLGDQPESGLFEARYVAFLETVTHLRPQLHRYCARMTGSPTEGEDVMQEALFDAYRKLDTIVEGRALAPWLFTIAHNRCIDTLRRRKFRARAEAAAAQPDRIDATEPVGVVVGPALERIGWEEFFRIFDRNDIAFLRDEEGSSRFNKFVAKETAHG